MHQLNEAFSIWNIIDSNVIVFQKLKWVFILIFCSNASLLDIGNNKVKRL